MPVSVLVSVLVLVPVCQNFLVYRSVPLPLPVSMSVSVLVTLSMSMSLSESVSELSFYRALH